MQDYLTTLRSHFLGKVAVVTGGGKGIGAAISQGLAGQGAAVCVADRNGADARATAARLTEQGSKAKAYRVDVADKEEVDELFRQVVRDWGRLDVLVNNAGIWRTTAFVDIPESEWDAILGTNLKGAFLCAQAAFRAMKERGGGVIISISSGAARSGGLLSPGWWNTYAHYAASKAGIESLTRSISLEGAAYGIRVNAVAPGPILTETMEKGYSAEDQRRLEAIIPLGRVGRPEDVANAVLFLASPHAGNVTGKTLDVNGGLLMD